MPIESTVDQDKLAALRQIKRPDVAQIVAVYWPQPDGVKYYSTKALNTFPNYQNLQLQVEPRIVGSIFIPAKRTSAIADDVINLTFSEIRDREISRLFRQHGEGVKVEIFYYFPQVDLFVSQWTGHMRSPQRAGGGKLTTQASSGFRSSQLNVPNRRGVAGCSAVQFGGLRDDLEECRASACPYAYHLTGDEADGLPDGDGNPFTTPAASLSECIARHGHSRFYLGFDILVESLVNNQTSGPALLATSKGNASNLKQALRVNYGPRIVRNLELLAYTPQFNTNHPDQGFVRVLFRASEGRQASMDACKVNGALIGLEHLNKRLGSRAQAATGFSPNISNFSFTAHFYAVYGPVNPAGYGPNNLNGECKLGGKDDIRVYTDDDTFVEQLSIVRAWVLLDVIRDERWGHKLDARRFLASDWIYLAEWCEQIVGYMDASGNHFTGPRSTFVGELNERSAETQIRDICLFGRFTLPFEHQGNWRILPLEKVTIDESIPVFTDRGDSPNIKKVDGVTTLQRTEISASTLTNKIVFTFEDAEHGNVERTIEISDQPRQLKAGKAYGDTSIRENEKKYVGVGINNLGEAVRCANALLDLGEFDSGGLANPVGVVFTTWYAHTLELYQNQVIRVLSDEIADDPFEYFRIQRIEPKGNLEVEIEARAYPADYYEDLEDSETLPPRPGQGVVTNPGGRVGEPPQPVTFINVTHTHDRIEFDLMRVL